MLIKYLLLYVKNIDDGGYSNDPLHLRPLAPLPPSRPHPAPVAEAVPVSALRMLVAESIRGEAKSKKLGDKMELAKELSVKDNWVILDTETTGLGPDAEIVQLGVLAADGTVLIDTLVKPSKPIPEDVSKIHGITNEMVENAPPFSEVYPKLLEAIAGKMVVVYNADYDYRMVKQSGGDGLKNDWLCAMQAYAEFYGDWNDYRQSFKWQSLSNACKQQNVTVENAHSAIGDCKMTRALILKLAAE